jgi:hypothetical protein
MINGPRQSPLPENSAIYEIMWENIVEPYRPQMTIWRIRILWCIPNATNAHSEYVTLIFHCDNGYANAPVYYVIRKLPVLIHTLWVNFRHSKVFTSVLIRLQGQAGEAVKASNKIMSPPPAPHRLLL